MVLRVFGLGAGVSSMSRGDVVMFKDFSSYVLIPVINLNFLIVFKYEGIV